MRIFTRSIVLILLLVHFSLAAKEKTAFAYPQTMNGKRIAVYFAAFNSGDEQRMTRFFKEHISADSLRRAPVEERLLRYRDFKKEAEILQPEKLLSQETAQVRVLVRSGKGEWLEMTFDFEREKPGKLMGILIDQVNADDLEDLAGPPLQKDEVLAMIGTYLEKQSRADLFSGVVLLAHQDEVIFHRAYGLASIEYGAANRLDTRFNLGSINKVFTSIAVEQLAEKGKLSKDDLIEKFLPDYPNREAARKVTVGHLLDMTSGIGDFFGKKYEETPKARIRTLADYLPLFAAEPLHFQPGKSREYSNGGYIVLGLIIEKACGQSYYDYVRENIYKPAGMEDTAHLDADIPAANTASGYTRRWDGGDHANEPRRSNIYTRPARGSSAGGGYSTAMDMLKFATALRAGKLLGPAATAWFAGPRVLAGGAPGINAELNMDPVPGYTVVVLGNYDPPAAMNVAKKIGVFLKRLKK